MMLLNLCMSTVIDIENGVCVFNQNLGMVWNERWFFHIPYRLFSFIPFPFHTTNVLFHTKILFCIPLHTSMPNSF